MGTSIRPEVSSKKEYWLSRHRYYELKHFCLQYPEWKRNYRALDGFAPHSPGLRERVGRTPGDPVTGCVAERLYYRERMEIVETAAREAADDLGARLTKAVTEGLSYETVAPPCCREVWYAAYRRFFWLLDKARK